MMQEFLIIIANENLVDILCQKTPSLRPPKSGVLRIKHPINPIFEILIVDQAIENSLVQQQHLFFKGVAVDSYQSSVIFGQSGFNKYIKENADNAKRYKLDGAFVLCDYASQKITIATDLFHQMSLLYTFNDSFFAASNSLYTLVQIRKALGFSCLQHEESILARTWENAFAFTPLSPNTIVEEIKYLPAGSSITADITQNPIKNLYNKVFLPPKESHRNTLKIKVHSILNEYPIAPSSSYNENLKNFSKSLFGLVFTLTELLPLECHLYLSGGLDSRLLFSALLNFNKLGFIKIVSMPSQKDDYKIVQQLSKKYSFSLHQPNHKNNNTYPSPLKNWFLANAGLYDTLLLSHHIPIPLHFNLSGAGAGPYKGGYGWKSIGTLNNIKTSLNIKDCIISETKKGLKSLGIKPNNKYGMEWHYLGFRNAIHFGRHTFRSSWTTISPLLQSQFINIGRTRKIIEERSKTKKNLYKYNNENVISDMLILTNPELAAQPFAKKRLDRSYIQSKLNEFGGPLNLNSINKFKVFGDINKSTPNRADFFDTMSEKINLPSNYSTRKELIKLAEDSLEILDSKDLRLPYINILDKLNQQDTSLKHPINTRDRALIGKLISLKLLT